LHPLGQCTGIVVRWLDLEGGLKDRSFQVEKFIQELKINSSGSMIIHTVTLGLGINPLANS